ATWPICGRLSAETQHSQASAVQRFLRWCERESRLDTRVVAHFDMPRRPVGVCRCLPVSIMHCCWLLLITATFMHCSTETKLCLRPLFDTDIRASEACSLTADRVYCPPDSSFVRVEGKGRRERECPLGRQAALVLQRYLTRGRSTTVYTEVFLDRDGKPISTIALDKVPSRLRDVAGSEQFTGSRVAPHTPRRSQAIHHRAQGRDNYILPQLIGHENVQNNCSIPASLSGRPCPACPAWQATGVGSAAQSWLTDLAHLPVRHDVCPLRGGQPTTAASRDTTCDQARRQCYEHAAFAPQEPEDPVFAAAQ